MDEPFHIEIRGVPDVAYCGEHRTREPFEYELDQFHVTEICEHCLARAPLDIVMKFQQ